MLFSKNKKIFFANTFLAINMIMEVAIADTTSNITDATSNITESTSNNYLTPSVLVIILLLIIIAQFIRSQLKQREEVKKCFSLSLIITSNKLSKYTDTDLVKNKKISLDEVTALINQSSYFMIEIPKKNSMENSGKSDYPDPDKEIDFLVKINGEGKENITTHQTKMGLRDSITSPQCTLEFMQKLKMTIPEEFIRSI
ncbi:hypothetical protein [Thiothrix unzii]|uniref:Uncharacterized protein n=1 Tax=Thiothrix unzii TaxID=111769 RepID=A0A975F9V4_9GAMM|nr:hypothetical protein [Thiothrix unzii]QTR53668.1 hypothetical protein J9260_00830 [Thiothrix unzii]